MVTPKADLGFMLITPDLEELDSIAKNLEHSLGYGVLIPTFSCLSMTERSEYGMSEKEYAAKKKEEGMAQRFSPLKKK